MKKGPGYTAVCRRGFTMIAVFSIMAAAGCGYRFSGGVEKFPKDIRAVFVAPFVNRSRDVAIGREMASAVRSEVRRGGQIRVVDRLEKADAIISGVIRALNTRVIAVNSEDEALRFETELVVDLSLRRRSPDELLWRAQGSRLVEVFSGSRGAVVTTSTEFKRGTLNAGDLSRFTDIQLTESLKVKARGQLVQRMARELHHRLMEMF